MHKCSSILTPSVGHLSLLYSPILAKCSDEKFTISPWDPFDYLPPLKLTLFSRYIASCNLTFIFFSGLESHKWTHCFSTWWLFNLIQHSSSQVLSKFNIFSFYGYHSHKVFKQTQQSGFFPWHLFQFVSLTLTQQNTLDGLTSTGYHIISIL